MMKRTVTLTVLACVLVVINASSGAAPPASTAMPAGVVVETAQSDDDDLIQLSFPKTVDIKVLVEYVSKRLDINIIYDETVGQNKVSLLAPTKIRKGELLGFLKSVLNLYDLELVDAAQPGWKIIGRKAVVKFVTVKHVNIQDLAKRASAILEERDKIAGSAARTGPRIAAPRAATPVAGGADVTLVPDPKSGMIVAIGTEAAAAEAVKLIELMDVPRDLLTKAYRFQHVNPKRIDAIIKGRTESSEQEIDYASTIDEASGLLIATAPPVVHEQIQALVKELDVEADPHRDYVQFYKLFNTTASDVLTTIRNLQQGGPGGATGTKSGESLTSIITQKESFLPTAPSGMNAPSMPGVAELPTPPSYAPSAVVAPAPMAMTDGTPTTQPSGEGTTSLLASLSQNALVTSDQNTNTIIVAGPPEVQRTYRQLIAVLDKRRPQVLVEVTLVTMSAAEGYSLGVELSRAQFTSDTSMLLFNSFGLSNMNTSTGVPTINPGTGFNGVLLAPDTLNVVVEALATSTNSRVVSAPKILMNDNATGTLASVAESPFTSVNASDTVSTTSFAGYASAGATINITPHISEDDYLQLQYNITLNNFTGSGANGIPPPRQTNTVSSEITVPNGYTVVIGGLAQKHSSQGAQTIPGLGKIPIVKYLFGLHTQDEDDTALFVFIRPIILRDAQFEDLKYLSEKDLGLARLPSNYPASIPLIMQ